MRFDILVLNRNNECRPGILQHNLTAVNFQISKNAGRKQTLLGEATADSGTLNAQRDCGIFNLLEEKMNNFTKEPTIRESSKEKNRPFIVWTRWRRPKHCGHGNTEIAIVKSTIANPREEKMIIHSQQWAQWSTLHLQVLYTKLKLSSSKSLWPAMQYIVTRGVGFSHQTNSFLSWC